MVFCSPRRCSISLISLRYVQILVDVLKLFIFMRINLNILTLLETNSVRRRRRRRRHHRSAAATSGASTDGHKSCLHLWQIVCSLIHFIIGRHFLKVYNVFYHKYQNHQDHCKCWSSSKLSRKSYTTPCPCQHLLLCLFHCLSPPLSPPPPPPPPLPPPLPLPSPLHHHHFTSCGIIDGSLTKVQMNCYR